MIGHSTSSRRPNAERKIFLFRPDFLSVWHLMFICSSPTRVAHSWQNGRKTPRSFVRTCFVFVRTQFFFPSNFSGARIPIIQCRALRGVQSVGDKTIVQYENTMPQCVLSPHMPRTFIHILVKCSFSNHLTLSQLFLAVATTRWWFRVTDIQPWRGFALSSQRNTKSPSIPSVPFPPAERGRIRSTIVPPSTNTRTHTHTKDSYIRCFIRSVCG